MSSAEHSGEPLLAAASAWRLSYMVTGRKHPQEALELAMTAAAALDRRTQTASPERLSVLGALHLAAATAAAASFDRATTMTMLARARGLAGHTGETNDMGTALGPVNVAITPSRRRSSSATPGRRPRPVRRSIPRPCPAPWWAGARRSTST